MSYQINRLTFWSQREGSKYLGHPQSRLFQQRFRVEMPLSMASVLLCHAPNRFIASFAFELPAQRDDGRLSFSRARHRGATTEEIRGQQ